MSKLNLPRPSPGTRVTTVLGSLCAAGAVCYVAAVGGSLLPAAPAAPESGAINTVSGRSSIPQGPQGTLQIHVTDEARAYVQNLTCTGDPEADPEACTALARQIAEEEIEDPFEEVAKGAVCTEMSYGPQTAVITGTWEGEKVDTRLNREDSCEEARWQRLTPLTDPLS